MQSVSCSWNLMVRKIKYVILDLWTFRPNSPHFLSIPGGIFYQWNVKSISQNNICQRRYPLNKQIACSPTLSHIYGKVFQKNMLIFAVILHHQILIIPCKQLTFWIHWPFHIDTERWVVLLDTYILHKNNL